MKKDRVSGSWGMQYGWCCLQGHIKQGIAKEFYAKIWRAQEQHEGQAGLWEYYSVCTFLEKEEGR